MSHQLNRREWLRSGALLTAGFGLAHRVPALAPESARMEQHYINEFAALDVPAPQLRARLWANENPHGISAKARAALVEAVSLGNRYPMQEFATLKSQLANDHGLREKNVLLSPGSSSLLMGSAIYYAANGGTVLTSRPTYDDLLEQVEALGGKVVSVPLTKTYQYDLDAMRAKVATTPNLKLVYIVNPNNPTGTIVPAADLVQFCRDVAPKVPVLVDEAYLDFLAPADRPALPKLIAEGLNVTLLRTFSKIHGMAGLRLGYALAPEAEIKRLDQYVSEWAVSVTTIKAGIASYNDAEWQNFCRAENAKARAYTEKELTALGYEVIPSQANFMLFPIRMKPKPFAFQMLMQGIGIQGREFDRQPFCRVSIGTMDEMGLFLETFKKVVS